MASDRLDSFIRSYDHNPKQGTPGWALKRVEDRRCVGGSELGALLNLSPYLTREEMVLKHSCFQDAGSLAVDFKKSNRYAKQTDPRENEQPLIWGIMFEECAARVIELKLDTQIVGSDIMMDSPYPWHRNSPDGFCITKDGECALIEIKSPWYRHPNGAMPKHYMPQTLSGLEISKSVTDFGLYTECLFRRCSFRDIDSPTAYRFHKPERSLRMTAMAKGIIGIARNHAQTETDKGTVDQSDDGADVNTSAIVGGYSTDDIREDDEEVDEMMLSYNGSDDHGLVDYGECECGEFAQMLYDIADKKSFPIHLPEAVKLSADGNLEKHEVLEALELEAVKLEQELIGFIPWKCFQMQMLKVNRADGFLQSVEPSYGVFAKTLDAVDAATTRVEAAMALRDAKWPKYRLCDEIVKTWAAAE